MTVFLYSKYFQKLTAHSRIFIASIFAIGVTVTFPGVEDAPAIAAAFELDIRARLVAELLVRLVSAVIDTVTDVGRHRAVLVSALEGSIAAHTRWTGGWLI